MFLGQFNYLRQLAALRIKAPLELILQDFEKLLMFSFYRVHNIIISSNLKKSNHIPPRENISTIFLPPPKENELPADKGN
jgi:NifB/MoaA-like Fe-S oxidoreductase